MKINLNRRVLCISLLGSAIYGMLYAFGYEIEHQKTCVMPDTLFKAMCLIPFFALGLYVLLSLCRHVKQTSSKKGFSTTIAFFLILTSYLLMTVVMYPGTFCIDTGVQIGQIVTGQYNTHHPLLHTLFLQFCIEMVRYVGTLNRALAMYSVLQSVIMAGCFALTSASIARSSHVKAGKWSAVFFALYPLHLVFASTATKDVLFSSVFALLIALMTEAVSKESGKMVYVGIVLCGMTCCLMRNNMVYAAAVWLIILIVLLRRKGTKLIACVGLSILLALGANSALIEILHAQRGDEREMMSWPIQQLARARLYAPERLTEEEIRAIDRLIVKEKWREYDPRISDPVKGAFDTQEFKSNLREYVGVYGSVAKKCPQEYLDAVVAIIYPMIYPYEAYKGRFDYVEVGIDTGSFDQVYGEGRVRENERFKALRSWLEKNIWKTGASEVPVIKWIFNMGVIVWLMLFFVLREACMHNTERFAVFLLPVMLWGTFLLGPTVYARYIYPFVCSLPVLASHVQETGRH